MRILLQAEKAEANHVPFFFPSRLRWADLHYCYTLRYFNFQTNTLESLNNLFVTVGNWLRWQGDLSFKQSSNHIGRQVCLSVTICDKKTWQSLQPKAANTVQNIITLRGTFGFFFLSVSKVYKSCNIRLYVIYAALLWGTLNLLTRRLHRIASEVNLSMPN